MLFCAVQVNGSLISAGEVIQPTTALNGSTDTPTDTPPSPSNDTAPLLNGPQVLTPVGDGSSNSSTYPATQVPPQGVTGGADYNTSGVTPGVQSPEVIQPTPLPGAYGVDGGNVSTVVTGTTVLPAGESVVRDQAATGVSPSPAADVLVTNGEMVLDFDLDLEGGGGHPASWPHVLLSAAG
jgi:hypothetical protein